MPREPPTGRERLASRGPLDWPARPVGADRSLPVAFRPCFSCGEKFPGKAATLYAGWMEDERRESFVTKICLACVMTHVSGYAKRAIDNPDGDVCIDCGAEMGKDRSWDVYVTAYLPNREADQFVVSVHQSCLAPFREWFEDTGTPAPSRDLGGARGPENLPGLGWEQAW